MWHCTTQLLRKLCLLLQISATTLNAPDPNVIEQGHAWKFMIHGVLLTGGGLLCLKQCLDGFYGSQNMYMNTRTQGFPLEL